MEHRRLVEYPAVRVASAAASRFSESMDVAEHQSARGAPNLARSGNQNSPSSTRESTMEHPFCRKLLPGYDFVDYDYYLGRRRVGDRRFTGRNRRCRNSAAGARPDANIIPIPCSTQRMGNNLASGGRFALRGEHGRQTSTPGQARTLSI